MLVEGFWKVRVLGGGFGNDDKNRPTARVNVEFIDGPNVGQRFTYNGRVDNKSAKYVARDLKSAGWKGGSMRTLHNDLEDAVRNKVETTAEVKHIESTNGRGGKFAVIGSLGAGPKPLTEPDAQTIADCDEAMRDFANAQAAGGSSADDDLPFARCDIESDPFPMAHWRRWA